MVNGKPVVVLDPGHGGKDPGAVGQSGLKESEVNLALAHLIRSRLERGFCVVMTRTGDVTVSLAQRCLAANDAKASLFASLHCNAAENRQACGVETYHYPHSPKAEALAEVIHKGLVGLGLRDRGVKPGTFYVLKHTRMPSVLVEVAFISNPEDEKRLGSTEFLCSAADAVADAIRSYLG